MQAGNVDESLAILAEVIDSNYKNPSEFQSIFNLQEYFISLLLKGHQVDDVSFLDTKTPASGPNFLPLPTDLNERALQIYHAFRKYRDYELGDKSTNAHNIRKSAILS